MKRIDILQLFFYFLYMLSYFKVISLDSRLRGNDEKGGFPPSLTICVSCGNLSFGCGNDEKGCMRFVVVWVREFIFLTAGFIPEYLLII
jgi:hypothetical protein